MDFHNRQYDPQLGRFLSVDPLADAGGQQVLSPYHAMGCNPVSMVDPLGLAFTLPSTWGMGAPTALDIALWQVPTKQLDKVYGGDPWSMMNRGVLNAYEADMAKDQRYSEMITGLIIRARYGYHAGLEKQREADLLAQADAHSPGKNEFKGIDQSFPESGQLIIDGVKYDLNSFVEFFREYGSKFLAKTINSGMGYKDELKGPVKLNGKSTDLHAEVGSYLTVVDDVSWFSSKTVKYSKSSKGAGTSYGFNYISVTDYNVTANNTSMLKIHTHPGIGSFILSYNSKYGNLSQRYYPGPSPADYSNTLSTSFSMRNVVVDGSHIYLYNYNPSQTIRIQYAK